MCNGYRKYIRAVFVLTVLLTGVGKFACGTTEKRQAAVYFSDGKVLTGRISLTGGRNFKLNIPGGGSIKTTDMVTGADVPYGKVRRFGFEGVREIRFLVEKEEMRRPWKFIEKTKYDEETAKADYTPAAKAYHGDEYPVRYLGATVLFNSGETLLGHLYTAVVYLKTKDRTHKLVLRSKQRGEQKTTLDDLVYVRRIKMLDEGKDIAAKITVKFANLHLGPDDALQAVTRETLIPIPTRAGDEEDTFVVESAFGEEFYLAARKDGGYLVGWPGQQDQELWDLADDHLQRQRDFYNEKKLLGVLMSENGKELLTLVNLRRRVAPTHFGKVGGEWDKELGTVVEPWRLSIWRWKYDAKNKELALVARGTFFRVIFLPEDPTPQVTVCEELWHMRQDKDIVIVGKEPAEPRQSE